MTSYPISSAPIETHYMDACEQFEHLVGRLKHPEAQKLTHGEVEAVIHREGMELLRRLTQGHLDQRSAQEPIRDKVIGEDGLSRTHRRAGCQRRLETRFGEVSVTRRGYGARGLESVFPLDAELNLPPDKYSHGLREALVDEVIRGAVAHLERCGGVQVAKRQSEEVAVHLSQVWLPKTSYVLIPLTFLLQLSYGPGMRTLALLLLSTLLGLLQSRALLHLEILALRQQLAMVNQAPRKRLRFHWGQRLFWVWLYRVWPGCLQTLQVFKPDTLVCWHRKGFHLYWTCKSLCRRGGRPPIAPEVRKLIRTMSRDNIGWGAPRIHGELQLQGIHISQTTVAKYMVHHPKQPSQAWRSFLNNHAKDLVSVDFFTVPTATFRILYVFLVLRHDRREIVHFNVTEHPTAQWTAQQIVEAFPWGPAPRFLLRDRD